MGAARSSGVPVEVLSARTERERTFANPDGSWTSEMSAAPIRVRQPDGSWTPVDTTLRRVGDQVVPIAVSGDVRFSAGGSGPAARVNVGARAVSLGVPWALPEPVLDGPRATYRNVLPGVDLVLTAQPDGFSEVLVVRNRAAAANPALRSIRFRLAADGLTLREQAGGFVAVDQTGREVFASPAPQVWDSSGGPGSEAVNGKRRVDRPEPGDQRARMSTSVQGDGLTVVPDRSVLDGPDTVFPVFVDPSVSASRSAWTMIQSAWSDLASYKFSGDEGMGLCDVQVDYRCNADNIKRLAWKFSIPTAVRGSHVLGATFKAYETHAWDCTADSVQLYRTGSIGSGTTWNNHASTWTKYLASVTVARKTGCSLGPGWVEFNAKAGVDEAVAGSWTTLTLGLKAGSETSMAGGWKRFRYDAVLSITYNRYPGVPTSLSTEGLGCGSGSTRSLVTTATPRLFAKVSDPDAETDLKANFSWEKWTGSAWSVVSSGTQSGLTSGSTGQYKISSGLVHDGIYRWRARTQDPWSHNGSSGTDSSAWSGYCEFKLDLYGPQQPPGVSSPVYGTDLNQTYGSVGLTADFTFTASGVTDVAKYKWGWASPPTTLVSTSTPGGSVTLKLTPPPPYEDDPTSGGLLTLYVVSVDQAGRESPVTTYPFRVGSASAPVGVWQMDEPAGSTTLADTNVRGTAHPLLSGATTVTAGRIVDGPFSAGPTAVVFDGSDQWARTEWGQVVVDTSKSFTVSAWARPTSIRWSAVASQAGANNNGAWDLQLTPDGTWAFDAYAKEGQTAEESPAVIRAQSTTPTALGKWTHLVGVYDAGAKQTRLYVNGTLAGTATVNSMFYSGGPIIVGAVIWRYWLLNFFAGDIAEVKVWDRVVSTGEVAPMARSLVGRWGLDYDGLDSTPYGRDATNGQVEFIDDGEQGVVASLAGNSGHWLSTGGPALRTDHSFSVSVWARPTARKWSSVVSQSGVVNNASFDLQYTDDGTWTFDHYSMDGFDAVCTRARSTTATPLDEWVHLAVVYDASAGKFRLYVNGALAATTTVASLWHANGPFQIGRVQYFGSHASYFAGDINDVRVYAGVLTAAEITKLAQ